MADNFQLKAIITAVDKISGPLKGVQRSVRIVHKSLADIGRAGGQLMSKLGLPAALGFGAVAYGAVNATRAALDYASGIQDAAERTGATTGAYQVLSNMLGAVGGTAEDAEMAFTKFNKGIADAASGADKSFAGLMQRLNIPLRDAKGNLQSLTAVLPQLADAFAAQTDPAMRTRMAMEFFGKGGAKMIPIMLKGGDSVRAMATEMELLGVVLDAGAVGALDDMGDSLGFVGKQIRTQWTSALASLVPVLLPMIKQLTLWIAANKEIIKVEIVKVLTEIATALRDVNWVEVIKGIRETIVAIKGFVDSVGGARNVMIGMGAVFLAGPVAAIMSIGFAVWRAITAMSALLFTMNVVRVQGVVSMVTFGGAIVKVNAMLGASFIWMKTQVVAAAIALRFGGVAGLASAVMASIGSAIAAVGATLMAAGKMAMLFGRTLLLSPLGAVLALATAAFLIYKNWDTLKSWFGQFTDWLIGKFTQIGQLVQNLIPDWARNLMSGGNVNVNQNSAGGTGQARTGALLPPGRAQVSGEMVVRFENTPPGTRVNQGKTNQPGFALNPDVGYRTLGQGL